MDIETKLDQILKIVTMTQHDLATMKRDFQELKDDVAILKQDVAELKERLTKLEERVTKMEERIASLERSVFLIETQHGEKIKALFDNMKVNENEHKKLENLCLSIKSEIQGTLFSHEKRISKLEGNLVPNF